MTEIIIKLKNLNWLFVFLISFLSFVGLVMIYSATFGEESKIFISHIYTVIFGFILMILVSLVDIGFWKKILKRTKNTPVQGVPPPSHF